MCPVTSCVAGPGVLVSAALCIIAASHTFWVCSHETSCTHQAPSCLRTFARSIPSVGNTLPASVWTASSDPRPQSFRGSLMSPCGRYHKCLSTRLYGCVLCICLTWYSCVFSICLARWLSPVVAVLGLPVTHRCALTSSQCPLQGRCSEQSC